MHALTHTPGTPSELWCACDGGVFLNLAYHDKKLPLPKGIVVGHAAIAVIGYALLFMNR